MKKRVFLIVVIAVIFLLAAGIRLYDVTDQPIEFHAVRQLRAAIIARNFFKESFSMPEAYDLIEPPIMEFVMALVYFIAKQEIVWIGRIFSIIFWMLGGLALFDFSRKMTSIWGAVFALMFYFFVEFGILGSRTLMPDPMMIAMTMIAIWALFRWQEIRTMKWTVFVGCLTGFAVLTKSVAGFILLPAFALFILSSMSLKTAIKDKQVWTIFVLTALPSLAYYVYGIFVAGTLGGQFGSRFFPDLLIQPAHYIRWINNISYKFDLMTVVLGLIGIFLIRQKPVRMLLIGWWTGYFVYGMVFSYHIWTHDYYHLPLIPILAVSLAPAFDALISRLEKIGGHKLTNIIAAGLLLLFAGVNVWNARVELAAKDYRDIAKDWAPVVDAFQGNEDQGVIALTGDYATQLMYYGDIQVSGWQDESLENLRNLSGKTSTFDEKWSDVGNARFFIITPPKLLKEYADLDTVLQNYAVYAERSDFIIFDLSQSAE